MENLFNVFLIYVGPCSLLFFIIFYLISLSLKDVSVIDVAWGLSFALVLTLLLAKLSIPNSAFWLTLACVWLWAVRLSGYVFVRKMIYSGEDFRYANMRKGWHTPWRQSLTNVFLLQWVLMSIMTLPFYFLFHSNHTMSVVNIMGLILFLLGFAMEGIADRQKWQFKKHQENRGKLITTGLWRYCRHPNYFGEIMLWWGLFLITVDSSWSMLGLISPALITFFLVKVSGVTMLEQRESQYPDFSEYLKTTNALLPWRPK